MKKLTFATLLFCQLLTFGLLSGRAEENWQTNFDQAKTQAAQDKKKILLDFTGSDWCPWCVKMDREVFAQKQFSDFANGNLVLVKVDFPREKELPASEKDQNQRLASEFRIDGFPTYVLLDSAGREIKRQIGYLEGGPAVFVKWAGSK